MKRKLEEGKRKIKWTVLLVALLSLISLSAPRRMVFENPVMAGIDSKATEYVDAGLARAGAAFLLARTINAIISVFQESELQLEPGGIGVSFAVGEALDPINDMVERFSWVMLASLTSLGIQKVLIQVGAWFSISVVLFLGLLFLLAGLWVENRMPINLRRAGGTLILLAVLLRFAIPVMSFLNDLVYESVLEKKHDEASARIEMNIDELKKLYPSDMAASQQIQPQKDEQKGDSWLSKANDLVSNTINQGKNILDLKSRYEAIKNIVSGMFDYLVDLMVVFVINTILLPLIFLWGFLKLFNLLLGQNSGWNMEAFFKNKLFPDNKHGIDAKNDKLNMGEQV
jgi:uncharacterized membrane protein